MKTSLRLPFGTHAVQWVFRKAVPQCNKPALIHMLVIEIVCFAVLLGGCKKKEVVYSNSLTKGDLIHLISSVEPWKTDGNYSKAAWRHTVAVAKVFQQADSNTVSQAFYEFGSTNVSSSHGDYEENSKAFLLLRVMFDVQSTESNGARFRYWRHSGSTLPPMEWPVGWTNGEPFLVEGWRGSYGSPYDPRKEYEYFNRNFHFRPLKDR